MGGASRAVQRAIREVEKSVSRIAREEMEAAARTSAAGPDRAFSRFRRAGKLRVKFKRLPDGVLVVPVGPWGITEKGASPHPMKAWGRGRVQHPGTRSKQGRRAWSKGRDATFRRLGRDIPDEVEEAVVRGFEEG